MSETPARFNYVVMPTSAGKRSFYDIVLRSYDITTAQRVGCLVDYMQYLTSSLVEVADFTQNEAAENASKVVFSGLREHQEQFGTERTHDVIVEIDQFIRAHHRMTERDVFTAHPDQVVTSFYNSMEGMVNIPQGR